LKSKVDRDKEQVTARMLTDSAKAKGQAAGGPATAAVHILRAEIRFSGMPDT
jgi:hypothetical protein